MERKCLHQDGILDKIWPPNQEHCMIVLLIGIIYTCNNHHTLSYDPRVLSSINQSAVLFVPSHRAGFTRRSDIDLIVANVKYGVDFSRT